MTYTAWFINNTRNVCVDKVLFTPNVEFGNRIRKRRPTSCFLLLQNQLCYGFKLQHRDNELIKKVKMKQFFWLDHWSKSVFAI